MARWVICCLAAVFSSIPVAAAVDWESDPGRALERARAERKLLLVEIRSPRCPKCNDEREQLAYSAWDDAALAPVLRNFVMLRLEAPAKPEGLIRAITAESRSPSFTLADYAGQVIFQVKPDDRVAARVFAAMAISDPAVRGLALAAADARLTGDAAGADSGIGQVLMGIGAVGQAIPYLEKAAKEFRAGGEKEAAQRNDLYAAFCWYRSGNRDTAHGIAANVARRPATPAVGAEAWYIRGLLYLSDAGTAPRTADPSPGSRAEDPEYAWQHPGEVRTDTTPWKTEQRPDRLRKQAIDAFRKAYALAPAGAQILTTVREQLQAIDDQPLPARPEDALRAAVRLIVPARRPLVGTVEVSTDADVALHHVDYFVDDIRSAGADQPPFRTKIDLGGAPTVHVLKAVAFGPGGNAVGEAVVTVNDRADAVHVAITSPVEDAVAGSTVVEAVVDVPSARTLRSVDFFWNDERFATMTAPPFRRPLVVNGLFGYIRAQATLDDGTTSEDVRLVNLAGNAASVEVQGVTFIATVVDGDGRRVEGLRPQDFAVFEDEQPVGAATVDGSTMGPVTIGVALDRSGSMEESQLFAKDFAGRLIDTALRPGDNAFIATFADVPRLVQPATGDLARLHRALETMTTGGSTSIFDGVTFALQQFANVSGRKALLVVSDGREGLSSASARSSVALAKALGIPVYGVTAPGGQRLLNPLAELAAATGGLFVYAPARAALDPLVERIRDEVRGQYLITFVSKQPPRRGAWHSLRVAVPGHAGVQVRTVRGYYGK